MANFEKMLDLKRFEEHVTKVEAKPTHNQRVINIEFDDVSPLTWVQISISPVN